MYVISCRHVDDDLIDVPRVLAPEMISSFKIDKVFHGSNGDRYDKINTFKRGKRYKDKKDTGILPTSMFTITVTCLAY